MRITAFILSCSISRIFWISYRPVLVDFKIEVFKLKMFRGQGRCSAALTEASAFSSTAEKTICGDAKGSGDRFGRSDTSRTWYVLFPSSEEDSSADKRLLGVKRSWTRLLNGESGLVSVKDRYPQFPALPSTVAGVVPGGQNEDGGWDTRDWLSPSVGPI
jgi:hypothetical protein